MNSRSLLLSCMVFALALLFTQPQAGSLRLDAPHLDYTKLESDLKFDDIFPRKSWFGRTPSGQEWSHDGRYFAYIWNERDEVGADIWLYDTQTKRSTRVTTPEMMKAFDRDIDEAIKQHQERLELLEKRLTMTDREYREDLKRQEEENRRRSTPNRSYGNFGNFTWSNSSHKFLFTYRGDIYGMTVGDEKPIRYTATRDSASQLQFTKNDEGFFFRRGDGVFRVFFDSPIIIQLNPALPNNMSLGTYRISPNEDKLMIATGRSTGTNRSVDYIVYRGRFAEARTTNRGVADDRFQQESYVFLYDLNDDPLEFPDHDRNVWEVWKWPGGQEWQETSFADDPWSPDGEYLVFGTWARNSKDLRILRADLTNKRVRTLYQTTHDGEHRSPSLARPFFHPDGRRIICMLETDWRHAWIIDPFTSESTQITSGEFEVFPEGISEDGSTLYVNANPHGLSQMSPFAVDIETGEMTRLGSRKGVYGSVNFSPDYSMFAANHSSWEEPGNELVITGTEEVQVTNSHDVDRVHDMMKIKPELFTYENRHGQTIHGYQFLPPDLRPGEKRPLFIYVYGGPLGTGKSVVDGSLQSTGTLFNMYLAYTLGYITVTIDPRGQSGYGAEFGKANWEQIGVPQVEDLSDAVEYFDEKYGIDRERVGVTGWSFGGFQTLKCMFSAPDVFTLGLAGAGPTEWQNYNTWYSGGVVGPSRLNNPNDLDKYSLTHEAKNLRSPLLLIHGMEDTNVLFQDSISVYRQLLQWGLGHLVEFVVDPTGGHGLGGDINTRDRHEIYLAFIIKHWGMPSHSAAARANRTDAETTAP